MVSIQEVTAVLGETGNLLKQLRLARGDSQVVFGQRLGVSRATVRALESGDPTVSVGHWLTAWWALDRLGDIQQSMRDSVSLFDLPAAQRKPRKRAPRKVTE